MKIFLLNYLCGEYDSIYEKNRTIIIVDKNNGGERITAEDVLRRWLIKKNPFFNEKSIDKFNRPDIANYFGDEMIDDDGSSFEIVVREIDNIKQWPI